MKKKKLIILLILLACIGYLVWDNTTFMVSEFTVKSDKIPKAFDGYKIVQISDLHNAEFGNDNEKLFEAIKKEKPDMIAITGDVIDGSNPNVKNAEKLVKKAVEIAPCCYVSGNHELFLDYAVYSEFAENIKKMGVVVLENDLTTIEKDGEKVQIIGIEDQGFWGKDEGRTGAFTADEMMDADYSSVESKGKIDSNLYTIVLEHRPTFLDYFAKKKLDLVLTGHAHGGQFRIPFVGGVFAPDQGYFPKYDAGKYTKDDTVMIVSRGLGNSIIPVRVNNRAELVSIELHSK